MRIICVLVIIYSIVDNNKAQNIECDKKNENISDLMIQRLYLFGAADRKYPTTQKDMRRFCKYGTEKYRIFCIDILC